MSMFYELMMRKKTEIMYATIKGSLTENDGVFSGFSSSNYLELQEQIDISKPFEINIKIENFSATGSSQFIFGLIGNLNFGFYLGISAIGIGGQYSSSYWVGVATNMTVGSPFIINLKGDGTTVTATVIHDNTTQTSSKIIEDMGLSGNFTVNFGKRTDSQPFTSGSIDLNNSYIKLGATKYKIVAVSEE